MIKLSTRRRLVADYEQNIVDNTDAFTPGKLPRRHPDSLFSNLVGDQGSYITKDDGTFLVVRYAAYVLDQLHEWKVSDYFRYFSPPAWSVLVYLLDLKTSLNTSVFGYVLFENQRSAWS